MICWNSTDQDQNNLVQIAKWWSELKGQKVQWIQVVGTTNNPTTGETKVLMQNTSGDSFDSNGPVFTIENPTLHNTSLSFRGVDDFHELQVQQLELDAQNQQLQVTCSDGRVHVFKHQPAIGGIMIERMSL